MMDIKEASAGLRTDVNGILVGLKEKLEGRNLTDCVKKIISETLGIDLDRSQLQRVHRAPVPMPEEGRPPKPIIIWLNRKRTV